MRSTWAAIIALAKVAYTSTGDDYHNRATLLIGHVIDFNDEHDLLPLISRARAAKKAYDDELAEHGCWKVGDDGESNVSRWAKASDALAKAMIA